MGPLAGIRLLEIAGIGPGPMAAMMLVGAVVRSMLAAVDKLWIAPVS